LETISVNWLDRTIGFIDPVKAAKRAEARARIARLDQTKALYDAATLSRRTQGWRAIGTDANYETRIGTVRLRDAARDMVRNNAFAARAKGTLAHNIVGAGIVPRVTNAGTEKRTADLTALVKDHLESSEIDIERRQNLYGIQNLAMQCIVESGEVLIRKRPRRIQNRFDLPFQLQVLEPDYLDTFTDGELANGNFCVQGVEFNSIGERVAYYLYDRHPGGWTGLGNLRGIRVPASVVAHVYRVDRPGQVRGVSWFAPVMMRMRDFADYTDAQLMRQKIAACFAAFITTVEGFVPTAPEGLEKSPTGLAIEQFEPGMINRLREGESISFATPPLTTDFGGYSTVTLREIAAGLNITYEALTGDLTNVNYSSGRMGWLEYQRSIDTWRWNMLMPMMMDPLEIWTRDAVAVMTGSEQPFNIEWTPPRREMIDPSTEIEASGRSIRLGLTSRSEEIRRNGYDPLQTYQELAADAAMADKLGLVLDSDPRVVSGRGVEQKSLAATGDPVGENEGIASVQPVKVPKPGAGGGGGEAAPVNARRRNGRAAPV
jgi:lambda family phage portal protein